MKLLLLLFLLLYSTPCLGQNNDVPYYGGTPQNLRFGIGQIDNFVETIGQDKTLHMGGCYVISSTTASLVYNITENRKKAFIYGVASAVIIGGIKEIYDINHGDSNWADMGANVIGATLGALVVTVRF
jgi:UDP-N-acetylmuramyl pentapeptide phosphotransferase/UDP-N-acetylglucosamine-1-phosphate transferase